MSSLAKHSADTRRRLMFPDHSALPVGILDDYLIETLDQLVTEMNQTDVPWYLAKCRIPVNPTQSVYNLDNLTGGSAPYGKARYLYTVDDSNPNHQRRPVDLVSYEGLQENFGGGQVTIASSGVNKHSAESASVYYLASPPGPGNFIELGPIPAQAAEYEFMFEPATARPGGRGDTGFRFDQFDAMVAALTALRVMSYASWKGLSEEKEAKRKQEIRDSLIYDLGSIKDRRGWIYLFWAFRQANRNVGEVELVGWAMNRR